MSIFVCGVNLILVMESGTRKGRGVCYSIPRTPWLFFVYGGVKVEDFKPGMLSVMGKCLGELNQHERLLKDISSDLDHMCAELKAYRRLYPAPPPHIIEEELQKRRKAKEKELAPTKMVRKMKKSKVDHAEGKIVQLEIAAQHKEMAESGFISKEFKTWRKAQQVEADHENA